jgi:antirestriction protein
MTTPRIYVACLASYNNGVLHGAWIDAGQSADEIHAEIQEMLAASPENHTCQWCGAMLIATAGIAHWDKPCTHTEHWPGHAEEFAVHDYENFGPLRIGEYESIERIAAIAAGIAEHGEAFVAWLSNDNSHDPTDIESFDDSYRGEWDSLRAYAEEYADATGLNDAAEKAGSPYIVVDIEALERDLDIEMSAVESDRGTVFIFDPAAS